MSATVARVGGVLLATALVVAGCERAGVDAGSVQVVVRPSDQRPEDVARLAARLTRCFVDSVNTARWVRHTVDPEPRLAIRLPADFRAEGAPRPSPTTAGWHSGNGSFLLLERSADAEINIDPVDPRTVRVNEGSCRVTIAARPAIVHVVHHAARAAPPPGPTGPGVVHLKEPAAYLAEITFVTPSGGVGSAALYAPTPEERHQLLTALTTLTADAGSP